MISLRTNSSFALRDLRNLPDDVTIALLQNEIYAAATTDRSTPLSHPVFEHLWTRFAGTTELASRIVARALTTDQRALVVASEKRIPVLRTLAQYNILSPDELKAVPASKMAIALSYSALDYYENDPEAMQYLGPELSHDVSICYQLRRSAADLSDAEVLAAASKYFDRTSGNFNETSRDLQVQAMRDLVELRPHLTSRLARIPDSRVHRAIAESRFAGAEDVLTALLKRSPTAFTTTYAYDQLDAEVLRTLARNLVVPKEVRIACVDATGMNWTNPLAYSIEVTTSPDFTTVDSRHHINWLVHRTLTTDDPFINYRCQDWDILELAKNPNLSRHEAEQLLIRLRYSTVQHRLGSERCYNAKLALCKLIGKEADTLDILAPAPVTPSRVVDLELLRTIDLAKTVAVEFSDRFGSPKDSATLLAALGQTPHAWLTFIQALDVVDPDTTIQKVVDTTARLAYAI